MFLLNKCNFTGSTEESQKTAQLLVKTPCIKSARLPIVSFQGKKNEEDRQYKSANEISGNNTENREGPNLKKEKQKDVFAGTELGEMFHMSYSPSLEETTKRSSMFSTFSCLCI